MDSEYPPVAHPGIIGESGAMAKRAMLGILCLAVVSWAGEPVADAPTRLLPSGSLLVMRFPSPDRFDAIMNHMAPVWKALREPPPRFERMLSKPYKELPIDRKRPWYSALLKEGPVYLYPIRADAQWEPVVQRVGADMARRVGDMLLVGSEKELFQQFIFV